MSEYKFKTGRSGSEVTLHVKNGITYVRKDNIKNCEQVVYNMRNCLLPTPTVLNSDRTTIEMEYLPGITVYEYLMTAGVKELDYLVDTLLHYIEQCLINSTDYDFAEEIQHKCNSTGVHIEFDNTVYPRSGIHGDLTFDNMVFYKDKFYFIDFNHTELNSIYFDVNKLRQDLDAYWFIRDIDDSICIKMQVKYIRDKLISAYPDLFDDTVYKFMLSRILPYVSGKDEQFIKEVINIT